MNIYKSSGELKAEQVAEGAEIAASTHKMSLGKTVELTYSKYRKVTGIESIGKLGYDVAVLGSNEAMLRDVQKAVRKSIYDGIALLALLPLGSVESDWRYLGRLRSEILTRYGFQSQPFAYPRWVNGTFVFHGFAWFVNEWRNMVAVICLSANAEAEWLT